MIDHTAKADALLAHLNEGRYADLHDQVRAVLDAAGCGCGHHIDLMHGLSGCEGIGDDGLPCTCKRTP